jgi:hypothetical protein
MEKGNEGLDSQWKTKSLDTFCEEGSYTKHTYEERTNVEKLGTICVPALHERGQKSARQAQHESDEPHNVHARG